MKNNLFINFLTICLALNIGASAQKLPAVQQISLRAPANIKTDGKATEWNNEFQAYNKATGIFYTIANDADNLYLTVQATNVLTTEKILSGGITLSLKSNEKKIKPVALTFPVIPEANSMTISQKIKKPETKMDSELVAINNLLITSSKQLRVTGIQAVTDTLPSVYNEYGLKVAQTIDINRGYTYELAVPLKYLQPFISEGQLKYNIKLNGKELKLTRVKLNGQDVDPNSPQVAMMIAKMGANSTSTFRTDLLNPTDFSGTYALAK